jgi:hypothetical protein
MKCLNSRGRCLRLARLLAVGAEDDYRLLRQYPLRLSSLEDVVCIIDEVVLVVIDKRLNRCGGASVVGQDCAIDDGRTLEIECAENHLVSPSS